MKKLILGLALLSSVTVMASDVVEYEVGHCEIAQFSETYADDTSRNVYFVKNTDKAEKVTVYYDIESKKITRFTDCPEGLVQATSESEGDMTIINATCIDTDAPDVVEVSMTISNETNSVVSLDSLNKYSTWSINGKKMSSFMKIHSDFECSL